MVGTANTGDNIVHRMALEDRVPWYKKKNLRYMYFMLFPTCMGIEMTSGFDSQIINAVQLIPQWKSYFGNPTGAFQGILSAILPLGAVIGLPFIPLINDNIGRRWCVMFGSIMMIIGSLLQGFSINAPMYIIARGIIGFGLPYAIVAGSSLIGELAYPKERPVMTSMFNAAYFIGAIVAACVTFGTTHISSEWSWRIPSLLQMAPSLLQVAFIFFLPESPRFLISKDRHEEAFKVIAKYHAEGNANSELVKAEMAEIKTTIAMELENSKKSWTDMFKSRAIRKKTLIGMLIGLMTQLSGNVVISYYTGSVLTAVGFTDPLFQSQYNIGNQVWNFIGGVACALVVMKFRRRTMYLTAILYILAVYVAWTICWAEYQINKNEIAAKFCLFWIYAYAPGYNLGFNALTYSRSSTLTNRDRVTNIGHSAYLIEIFPYAQRTRGIAIFQFFGKLAQTFGTFVNPIGLDPVNGIGYKFMVVYCCWIAFEGLLIWWLWPETSGRTLEELAFLFEDPEKIQLQNSAVEKKIKHTDRGRISDEKFQTTAVDETVHVEGN